jgi:hypothetical protein
MPTIRNPADKAVIVTRLRSLTPDTKPLWGMFTAPRMICHLADTLRVPLGDIPTTPGGSILTRTIGKWLVVHTPLKPPHAKVQTLPVMLTTAPGIWAEDLNSCESLLDRIGSLATDAVHPRFGRLSPAEWGLLVWKHHDHHLRQFGA